MLKDILNEDIDIIDGEVVFKKNQESKILNKIERKLSQLDLFTFLQIIFQYYEQNKESHQIELEEPYKYAINLLVKNIGKSKHKNKNIKKMLKCFELINSFITLYQLKEDKFKMMSLTQNKLENHLTNQALCMNFYSIYGFKTDTLIQYIDNLINPSVDKDEFLNKFGFTIGELKVFLKSLDARIDYIRYPNIIIFNENDNKKILDFFSVAASDINTNYGTVKDLSKIKNIFALNPIIKYKDRYYLIGFRYFKMNFYSALVEKIRTELYENINGVIGDNIDKFVKDMFESIKHKYNFKTYSGRYNPPKKETPESDLAIELDKDIVFIENKNKYLTHKSFSGDSAYILKDYIYSFVFSQTQLLKHEKNLVKYKRLDFGDGNILEYNDKNIVKISLSANNWYNFMGNVPISMLPLLANMRFNIREDVQYQDREDFEKANKYLGSLEKIMNELENDKDICMKKILVQSTFIPLELIVEKCNDDGFIDILKSIVQMKMNVANPSDIYDYMKFINSQK